jgi:tetratricopeptide (TPR) repeat protein
VNEIPTQLVADPAPPPATLEVISLAPHVDPHLCLNSIVKNEAANLPRMLASVAPWITHYAILDTGSTDGTPDLIRAFFAERGIPGEVRSSTFHDYSQARNEALDLAADVLERIPLGDERFDYVLLVDADMELVVQGARGGRALGDRFPAISGIAQQMVQVTGEIAYDNTRLLHAAVLRTARYKEFTHEFLSTPYPPDARLMGAHFIDHATGSNRVDKFERDERLLKKALKLDPRNGRAHFYIAETYRNLGNHTQAIAHYKRRIELGGWAEEVWMARYQMSRSYLAAGLDKLGIATALEAYDERPTRTEPIVMLSKWLRERGRNASAAMLAIEACNRPLSTDSLFVETEAYRHLPPYELSIAGFFAPKESTKQNARISCLALSVAKGVPGYIQAQARANLQHYARRLSDLTAPHEVRTMPIPARVREDGWNALNPSVFRAPDGRLLCWVRRVNYTVTETGAYWVQGRPFDFDRGDTICTENELYELPEVRTIDGLSGFGVRFLGQLIDKSGREQNDQALPGFRPIFGFEDVRGFVVGDRVFASCTVIDRKGSAGCEMALLEIEQEGHDVSVISMNALTPPGGRNQAEKNWTPLLNGVPGIVSFVYQIDPPIHLIASTPPDLTTGAEPWPTMSSEIESRTPFDLSHLRGSSQAIPYGDGFLLVSHESIDRQNARRVYLHRFVDFGPDLVVRNVTEPFYFDDLGIEFCAGLAYADDKKTLVASYGSADAEARLALIPSAAVDMLLMRGPAAAPAQTMNLRVVHE